MSQSSSKSARQASLARRKAMSTTGKAAISGSADRSRSVPGSTATTSASATSTVPAATYTSAPQTVKQGGSARKAALARRLAMSKGGKKAIAAHDRTRTAPANAAASNAPAAGTERKEGCGCGCGGKNKPAQTKTAVTDMSLATNLSTQIAPRLKNVAMNPTRAATLARRKAMSTKGKAALKGGTVSEASAARAANPNISSRELAQALRTQRSQKGKTNNKKTGGTVATGPGRHRKAQAAAADASWKVGVTETASGQAVTGTMVDRIKKVTGNEASTCRTVTGTEYMGADVFKSFCKTEAAPGFNRVSVTTTGTGNRVSGNNVGRGAKVTGNEPGTCKSVTGTEYVSSEQALAFCSSKGPTKPAKNTVSQTVKGKSVTGNNVGRSEKVTGDETGAKRKLTGTQYMQSGNGVAPAKVAVSSTLRGGKVSGSQVGRSGKVTGDEPGSCRNVTGDDYIGAEQYSEFCKSTPAPTDRKVGKSNTLKGKPVTGTMTDRGLKVTGNEPGTCQSVTGTPYAGAVQLSTYCESDRSSMAMARARKGIGNVGPNMTGIQPGVGGVMTGASKGVCEPVSGTPYLGANQVASVCPATAATPAHSDFPQPLAGGTQPWNQFSVSSPAGEAQTQIQKGGITGSSFEKGHITGPFGMATGKVTGTEEARFGKGKAAMPEPVVATVNTIEGRVKSRITGEGMDAGQKITGDDWDRGDRVTGTEGSSATLRNPTMRGPMSSMAVVNKRNEEKPVPVSKVTGSSGNTEKGSLVTYSGGARG